MIAASELMHAGQQPNNPWWWRTAQVSQAQAAQLPPLSLGISKLTFKNRMIHHNSASAPADQIQQFASKALQPETAAMVVQP